MKTKSSITPSEFVLFASSVFRERQSALACLSKDDKDGAIAHLEYMETILSDTLFDMEKKSREEWRTGENCVSEMLANDIPREIVLTRDQAVRFTSSALLTISRFFRTN